MKRLVVRHSDALARAGMVTTMGMTLYTGFVRGSLAKMIHPWAGVAMVGFSYWHHLINTRKKKISKK